MGLRAAGHTHRTATHHNFRALVKRYGLIYLPLAGDSDAIMGSKAGHQVRDAGINSIGNISRLYQAAKPIVRELLTDALNALVDTDLAIGSPLGYDLAYGPAIKRGVPLYGAYVQPIIATADYQLPWFPRLPRYGPLKRTYNRATYPLFMRMMWLFASRIGIHAYVSITGLPAPHYRQIFGTSTFYGETLFGYSRHVVPKPREWGEKYHVCGAIGSWTKPATGNRLPNYNVF